jgi:hypothetical protein
MKDTLTILGLLGVSAIIGLIVGEKVFQTYFKPDLEEFKTKMLSQQK